MGDALQARAVALRVEPLRVSPAPPLPSLSQEETDMLVGETVIPRYAMTAAHAIGATPAKMGGPVGKYLYDIDLANGAIAALRAVHFEELCTALDDVCLLACRSDLAPDEDWDAAVEAGLNVLKKIRGEA